MTRKLAVSLLAFSCAIGLGGCDQVAQDFLSLRLDNGNLLIATCVLSDVNRIYAEEATQSRGGKGLPFWQSTDYGPTASDGVVSTAPDASPNQVAEVLQLPVLNEGDFLDLTIEGTDAAGGRKELTAQLWIPSGGISETSWYTSAGTFADTPCP